MLIPTYVRGSSSSYVDFSEVRGVYHITPITCFILRVVGIATPV